MKILNFKNAVNARDLGGFINKDKKETKYHSFIRSNCITKLDQDELNYFLNNNIKTVIDFREKDEIEKRKSFFENNKQFTYYNIVLKGRKPPKKEKDTPNNYMSIVDDKKTIYELFKIILECKTGILFHCVSGKDRTGVITMLLLLLANVSINDIIADYTISDIYLKDEIESYHKRHPNLPKFVGHSKKWYMEKTLELFFNKYQNIDNYMQQLGFNDKEINKIKCKLI